jgi:hypothetical protein
MRSHFAWMQSKSKRLVAATTSNLERTVPLVKLRLRFLDTGQSWSIEATLASHVGPFVSMIVRETDTSASGPGGAQMIRSIDVRTEKDVSAFEIADNQDLAKSWCKDEEVKRTIASDGDTCNASTLKKSRSLNGFAIAKVDPSKGRLFLRQSLCLWMHDCSPHVIEGWVRIRQPYKKLLTELGWQLDATELGSDSDLGQGIPLTGQFHVPRPVDFWGPKPAMSDFFLKVRKIPTPRRWHSTVSTHVSCMLKMSLQAENEAFSDWSLKDQMVFICRKSPSRVC